MITKDNLLSWLKGIDEKLDHKITLVAVGGTAMTLLNLKPSTRDVDFCLDSKEAQIFKELTKDSDFKVDIFTDGFIFSEQLPDDYITCSRTLISELKNIDLRTLSLIDIIITKAARYNERDEEDIETISKRAKINPKELKSRFEEVIDTFSGREEDYRYHIDLIIKRHFNEAFP